MVIMMHLAYWLHCHANISLYLNQASTQKSKDRNHECADINFWFYCVINSIELFQEISSSNKTIFIGSIQQTKTNLLVRQINLIHICQ